MLFKVGLTKNPVQATEIANIASVAKVPVNRSICFADNIILRLLGRASLVETLRYNFYLTCLAVNLLFGSAAVVRYRLNLRRSKLRLYDPISVR